MAFFRNTKRVLESGFNGFWRNSFVTISAVFVLTITLFLLGGFLYFGSMLDSSLNQIEDRVDVNVYFTTDAAEEEILNLREILQDREDVAEVEYVSQSQALTDFRSENRDDDLIVQALGELDENPLGAYFNIQATSPDRYKAIVNYLENSEATAASRDIIDRVNFYQNETAIQRLNNVIDTVDTFSLVVMIIFGIVAGLIVFNTIRLAIYASKDEIAVMELMGASKGYIRGPFIVEGILYGIVAALITLAVFYPLSYWAAEPTRNFFGTVSSFDYYIDNFAELFVILMVVGIGLGGISSYIAVKKYLDV
jgi:cell division transport system permease protein